MDYEFHLQDPTSPATVYLVEAIIAAARGATELRGMFAFASRGGVDSLLGDPAIEEFLEHGALSLLIGMDAITSRGTLERLQELETAHERLSVRVFWNRTAALFHPKIAHFTYPDGRRTVIVGSGNLTPGGLRQNFEAFSVYRVNRRERVNLNGWDRFLGEHAPDIRAIDAAALERAARNVVLRARRGLGEPAEPDVVVPGFSESDVVVPVAALTGERILVAEVPRAGGRWHQVHFNREAIDDFFQVRPNSDQRVYLTECLQDGRFGEQEMRPCVLSQTNMNHKIELGSHHSAEYPASGRPIAVFRELQARSFAYMLLMPGDPGHREMTRLLRQVESIGRGVPRVITTIADLRRAWPACPLDTRVRTASSGS